MQLLRHLDVGQFGPPDDYDGASSVIPLFLVAEIQIELAEIATSTPPRASGRSSLSLYANIRLPSGSKTGVCLHYLLGSPSWLFPFTAQKAHTHKHV